MKKLILLLSILFFITAAKAQNSMGVGTTSPNPNAVLHLVSPTGDQGFLVPKYTTSARTATTFTDKLSSADNGLMVFDTDEGAFYFWFTDQWVAVSGSTGDMLQSLYDSNADNIVDNAEMVNGLTVETAVPTDAVFTDSQVAADVAVLPSGDLSASDVQSALEELQTEINGAGSGDMLTSVYDQNLDGYTDTASVANSLNGYTIESSVPEEAVFTDSQSADMVPVTATGNISSTDVQSALEEIQTELDGTGDMLQLTYDADANDIVDNAETVNGLTVETAVPTDAVFTDSQTAGQVAVTASGNLTSTDVQSALVELQSDIDAGSSGGDMLQSVYDVNSNGTVDVADSLSVNFVDGVSLSYNPVASALEVRDNGISTAKLANGSVTADKIGIVASEGNALVYSLGSWQAGQYSFSDLNNVPGGLADGDDVGITSVNTGDIVDGAVTDVKITGVDWSKISGVPAGLADGDDVGLTSVNTTDLVDGAVTQLKLATNSVSTANIEDGSVTSSKLGISVSTGQLMRFDGTDWVGDYETDPTWLSDRANLGSVGTINSGGNLIDWSQLKNVPAEIADGTDAEGLTSVGSGDILDDAITSPKIADGAVSNADLDKNNIPLSGFGTPTSNVSMGGYVLTNLLSPTGSTDAATKGYVDGELSSISLQSAYDNGPVITTTSTNNFSVTGDGGIDLYTNSDPVLISAGGGSANFGLTASNISVSLAGTVTATSFNGDGSSLTNLNVPIHEDEINGNLFAGILAGESLSGGQYNVLYGRAAGNSIITGNANTISGWLAGSQITSSNNTLYGYQAGNGVTNGSGNTSIGYRSGRYITTGLDNVAVGNNAGPANSFGTITGSVALGTSAIVNVDNGVALGSGAYVSAVNAVAIGSNVNAQTPNTIILGDGQGGSTYDVGIGTMTPASELEVNGTVTATSFTGDGSGLTNVMASITAPGSIGTVEISNGTIADEDLNKINIPLSGFGAAAANVSLGNNRLTNLSPPSAATDAANRSYVDTQVAGVVSSQWTTTGSDIYFPTGNVGIGINTPAEALEVNGNVEGADFLYASPLAKIYAITPIDFKVLKPVGNEDYSLSTGTSGISVGAYAVATGTNILIGAPVHLPDGAIITQIEVVGSNVSPTEAADFTFIEKSYSTATTDHIVATIPANTTGVNSFPSGALNIQINNNLANYLVTFEAWSSQATLTGVKIFYTVTKPD